jgi:hypothetical protein
MPIARMPILILFTRQASVSRAGWYERERPCTRASLAHIDDTLAQRGAVVAEHGNDGLVYERHEGREGVASWFDRVGKGVPDASAYHSL